MKKLWLHIGTHKTGTTTLQRFFQLNRQGLGELGIEYPTAGSYYYADEASQSLLAHSLRGERPAYIRRQVSFSREQCVADIRRDIANSPHPQVLVSSEHFSQAATAEDVRAIRQVFDGLVSSIGIIVYLRRQDSRMESGYNQRTKSGMNTQTLAHWASQHLRVAPTNHFLYDQKLDLFASEFGRENITVRVFERQQLHPQGLIHDFMAAIGVHDLSGLTIAPAENESLPVEVVEAMRCATALIPDAPARRRLCRLIGSSRLQGIDTGRYSMLDEPLRARINDFFRSSNERVAREYLARADGRLFLEPESSPLPVYPGMSPEKLGHILAQVLLQLESASRPAPRAAGQPGRPVPMPH